MINAFTPSLDDSILPNNIQAEECILGGILLDPEAISRIVDILPAEAFYIEAHKVIYSAMLTLFKRGNLTDLISVANFLEDKKKLALVGGRSKLATLIDRTVSAVNIDSLAELVLKKYIRRKAVQLGNEISQIAYERGFDGDDGDLLEVIKGKLESLISSPYCQPGRDPDEIRHNMLIEQMEKVEMADIPSSLKIIKKQSIGEKFRKTVRELDLIYMSSLVPRTSGELKTFENLEDECMGQEREWLQYGFIPKYTTMLLHSAGGVGKTKLAYELIYALLTGDGWGGYPTSADSRRVICYQTDESPHDMYQALKSRGFDTNNAKNFRYRRGWSVDDTACLIKDLKDFQPDLIVIDSLTAHSRYSIYSENDVEYARPLLVLAQLAEQYKCSIIVVHHSSYTGNSRGTTAIFNAVSEVWSLKKDADSDARILEIQKSRSRRPAKYKLTFEEENYSWTNLGEISGLDSAADSPDESTKDRLIKLFLDTPNIPYELDEISHIVGGNEQYIRKQLNRLHRDGLIGRKYSTKGRVRVYTYFIKKDKEVNTSLPVDMTSGHQIRVCPPVMSTRQSPCPEPTLSHEETCGHEWTPKIVNEKDFSNTDFNVHTSLRGTEALPSNTSDEWTSTSGHEETTLSDVSPSYLSKDAVEVEKNTPIEKPVDEALSSSIAETAPTPQKRTQGFPLGAMVSYSGKDKNLANRYKKGRKILQIVSRHYKDGQWQYLCASQLEDGGIWLAATELSARYDNPIVGAKTKDFEHKGTRALITKFLNAVMIQVLPQKAGMTPPDPVVLPPCSLDEASRLFREAIDE